MAEKSKVKWKKWVIALAILVAIAIVVVVVIFTIPKDTNKVKQAVASHTDTIFLNDEEEQTLINSLKRKTTFNDPISTQIGDVETLSDAIGDMLTYYDGMLYLAQDNSTFQHEYGKILNAFNAIDNSQTRMLRTLEQIDQEVNYAESIQLGWEKFNEDFQVYIKNYATVFDGLSNVFENCIKEGTINNPLVCKTLHTFNDFLNVISEDKLKNHYYIVSFNTFAEKYLMRNGIRITSSIYQYNVKENLQLSLEKINKFSSIYENQSVVDVIKSMSLGSFKFEKSETDTDDVLGEVITFLKGELK